MHNLGYVALDHHDHAAAARWLDADLEEARNAELDLWRLSLLEWQAALELVRGCWTEAAATAQRLIDEPLDSPAPERRPRDARARAGATQRSGHAELLAEANASLFSSDDVFCLARIAAARAEVAWLERRMEDVDAATRDVFRLAVERGSWPLVARLGYWRHKHGLVDELPGGLDEP
jgi:hypothetical protein